MRSRLLCVEEDTAPPDPILEGERSRSMVGSGGRWGQALGRIRSYTDLG